MCGLKRFSMAIVLAGGLGVSASASAGAYALSYLNIYNLAVSSPPALGLSNFTSFVTNSEDSATLDGAPVSDSDPNVGGPADAAAVTATGSTNVRGENTFTSFGAVGRYSNADAQVPNTELVGNPPNGVSGNATQALTIAEGHVSDLAGALASSNNNSSTAVTFTAATAGAISFNFRFNADVLLDIALTLDAQPGSLARASTNMQITITSNLQGDLFSYSPSTLGLNSALGGTVNTATGALVHQIQTGAAGGSVTRGGSALGGGQPVGQESFNIDTNAINVIAGEVLTIGLEAGSDIGVTFAPPAPTIPEPVTMLLLGAGLAGIAVFGRRRKDQMIAA